MYDPDLYDSYSEFQRRDARELVPYMVSNMRWKAGEKILDFGCGSGYNTKNVLAPYIQSSKRSQGFHIYGIDVSKKMIDFAADRYDQPNITYMLADVMKDDCEFPCKFDKIFSFHVLHWIFDQEKALNRLYDLLETNGEIAFYYISNAAVFSVYDAMSRIPIWAPYMKDVKKFIPKSYYSEDPAKDVQALMTSIGYCVQEAVNGTRHFTFSTLEIMIDAAMAANPFVHRVPEDLKASYRADFKTCFLDFVHNVPTEECPEAVEVDYGIVMIRAKKF